MGPAGPLIAMVAGALLGGFAGGTAGGVYTCSVEGDHYVIKYQPEIPAPEYYLQQGYNHHHHPLPYSPYYTQPLLNYPPAYRYQQVLIRKISKILSLVRLDAWMLESQW